MIDSVIYPVLGTELRTSFGDDGLAVDHLNDLVLTEIQRLEAELSIFRPDSDLVRWRSGEIDQPGHVVREVLNWAERWRRRSHGALNPNIGRIEAIWRDAAQHDQPPTLATLSAVASEIAHPSYRVEHNHVTRLRDTSGVNCNCLAKGYIVDQALAAVAPHVSSASINIGGEIAHAGVEPIIVTLAHSLGPQDPIRIILDNSAVATSGQHHRGYQIAGTHYGHILDPRTGMPSDGYRHITVVAADAMTADALTTSISLADPDEACEFVESNGGAAFLVCHDRKVVRSASWDTHLQ